MKTNFLLIKICFNSMENHDPEHEEPVAIFTTKEKLDDELAELKKLKTFRGYDGQMYPQYRSIELPVDMLPPTVAPDQIKADAKPDERWLTDEQRACEPG